MRPNTSNMAFASAFGGVSLLAAPRRVRLPHHISDKHICASAAGRNLDRSQAKRGESTEDKWTTEKVRAPRRQRGGGRERRGSIRIQGKYYRPKALPPQPPGLRVSSGTARGRRIKSPNVYLRPMMAKVREALFSMLEMFQVLRSDGATLDLFAGSGSIGIESLSRGMGRAVFVDAAHECTETIEENLIGCRFDAQGQTVCARVENFVKNGASLNNGQHYNLITVTPPYEEVNYSDLMTAIALSDCVGEDTFVVVEYPVELKSLPPVIGHRLIGLRNRRYGRTVLGLYVCNPTFDINPRPEEFIDVTGRRR